MKSDAHQLSKEKPSRNRPAAASRREAGAP